MANNCYSVLVAPDIEKIWDGKSFETIVPTNESEYKEFITEEDTTGMWGWRKNNWGCDGRIFCSESTEGIIQLLTAWNPPYPIIARLSKILGDVELKHSYQDQENYG